MCLILLIGDKSTKSTTRTVMTKRIARLIFSHRPTDGTRIPDEEFPRESRRKDNPTSNAFLPSAATHHSMGLFPRNGLQTSFL
jgi:hypothetical protein